MSINESKDIWSDEECTVEEEYNSPVVSRSPNATLEFKNSLIGNKGDIRTARKISCMDTVVYAGSSNDGSDVSSYYPSCSDSSMGSVREADEDYRSIFISKKALKIQFKRDVNKNIPKTFKLEMIDDKFMSSYEILKKMVSE